MPLVTWSTPANVSESGLRVPSLAYCVRRWAWRPEYVVADMGYLGAEAKRLCRQRWRVKVITHVRANMKMVPPFESEKKAVCPKASRSNGWVTTGAATSMSLARRNRRRCAPFAGSRVSVLGVLIIPPPTMKRCWDYCLYAPEPRSTCSKRCGPGLNPPKLRRKTNSA